MCGESRKHGFEWECRGAILGSTPNSLKDRAWDCVSCETKGIQRDWMPLVNILRLGASSLGVENVREVSLPILV